MEIKDNCLIFNQEECFISTLPERLPLDCAGVAFNSVLKVKDFNATCLQELMTADFQEITREEVAKIPNYMSRVIRLNKLLDSLGVILAPQMVNDLIDSTQS